MGYANIPFAIGWAVGGLLGGFMYEEIANKTKLAREYMVQDLNVTPEFVMDETMLPKERVMETMAQALRGRAPDLDGQVLAAWTDAEWTTLPQDELQAKAVEVLDGVLGTVAPDDIHQATQILWERHRPYRVWYCLGAIGLVGTLGMIGFYLATRNRATPAQRDQSEPATD
jgi:hypothetical protein